MIPTMITRSSVRPHENHQESNTDFLICAVAQRYGMPIFTEDRDFLHYRDLLPIELYQP